MTGSDFTVTCDECGYSGTIDYVKVHSCYVQEMGGRCEDYPACGHTDGDGCQTLPSHTAEFYMRPENAHLMHEPGTPEYYDALEAAADIDDEADDDDEDYAHWYENGNKEQWNAQR